MGGGCPSVAVCNDCIRGFGNIPSEAFDINGTNNGGTTSEPSSIVLFGSGILGLAGILRRQRL